jgi:glycosyltransferase involved in cell wall biosynthesis
VSYDVSVVMATCRRPELLARCLNALTHQSLDAARYEIVVVDDGQDDATEAAVQRFAIAHDGRPAIRYLRPLGTRGPAGARNRGWRASAAPVIAFTDDDTVPDRDWLREGLAALTPQMPALAGRIVVPASEAPTDHERMTRGLERAEFATANVFVWRQALQAVNGFDERFLRAWREDSDLHFSLLKHCGPVGWAPAAVVVHPVRAAPWGLSVRNQANVYFDALLYKKHPQLYRHKVRRHPPWHYFLIVGCSLAALAAFAAGAPWPALLLLAAALVGIAGFAVHRLRGTSHAPPHVAEMLLTSAAIPFAAVYWRTLGALRFRTLFP